LQNTATRAMIDQRAIARRKPTALPNTSKSRTPSRIQQKNRNLILDAALEVFANQGFRGATLDAIAAEAGLSKPNILYYFSGKEEIHVTLLNQLLETWLDPLKQMDPNGDPKAEILKYVHRKLDMAMSLPRESRLFANEILQGAPRIRTHLETDLKPLLEDRTKIIETWITQGKIARCNPTHLIFAIWSTTQHYADFAAQIDVLTPDTEQSGKDASVFLDQLFSKLLDV
jgi:TetR/AcrR family transcriptional regulator